MQGLIVLTFVFFGKCFISLEYYSSTLYGVLAGVSVSGVGCVCVYLCVCKGRVRALLHVAVGYLIYGHGLSISNVHKIIANTLVNRACSNLTHTNKSYAHT